MAQLAVLATQRRRARLLLVQIASTADRPTLSQWLQRLIADTDREVQHLGKDLESALLPELQDLPFTHFIIWLEKTRRYSFYL